MANRENSKEENSRELAENKSWLSDTPTAIGFVSSFLRQEDIAQITGSSTSTVRRWQTSPRSNLKVEKEQAIRKIGAVAGFLFEEYNTSPTDFGNYMRGYTVDPEDKEVKSILEIATQGNLGFVIDSAIEHFSENSRSN